MEYLTNSFQGKISYDKGKSTVKKIECQINLYFQKGPQLTTYMENRKLEGRLRSSTISDCLIVFPKEGEITDNLILDKYKSDNLLTDADIKDTNYITTIYRRNAMIKNLYERDNFEDKLKYLSTNSSDT